MQKRKDIRAILITVAVIVVVNIFSFNNFWRLDLTEDQRFSISDKTKEIVADVTGKVYVEILFDGTTSAEYQQLFRTVKETLDELKIHSDNNIVYLIAPPAKLEQDSLIGKKRKEIQSKGIKPRFKTEAGQAATSAKLVFPGAIVSYNNREVAINFIKDGRNGAVENFNQSINEVEFEFASAIKTLNTERIKRVAFLGGHNELPLPNITSICQELVKYYDIPNIAYDLSTSDLAKDSIDILIVAQPKAAFSEQDKYKLDQYAINGGRILYFLDALELRESDSIQGFVTKMNPLEIGPLLRTYGVRLEDNLVQDYVCERRPIKTENGQTEALRYSFYPTLSAFSTHISVKGQNPVLAANMGTLDTLKADGMKRTPLMFTSKYTKVKSGGLIPFNVQEMMMSQDESTYPLSHLPVAYLCEGELNSMYTHRPKPDSVDVSTFEAKGQAKVIVVSDGDIIRNRVNNRTREPAPLGMSIYAQNMVYANTAFVMNLVNYLLDENGVVTVKAKEIKPRPLDEFKFDESSERMKWVFINLGIPMLAVLLFAVGRYLYRRKRYM